MKWMKVAQQRASTHPTIVGLRSDARLHRQESENDLVLSAVVMRQPAMQAHQFEVTANRLEMEMVAKTGVAAGVWKSYLVGRSREVGAYSRS